MLQGFEVDVVCKVHGWKGILSDTVHDINSFFDCTAPVPRLTTNPYLEEPVEREGHVSPLSMFRSWKCLPEERAKGQNLPDRVEEVVYVSLRAISIR